MEYNVRKQTPYSLKIEKAITPFLEKYIEE
jgi:hypothetical protein